MMLHTRLFARRAVRVVLFVAGLGSACPAQTTRPATLPAPDPAVVAALVGRLADDDFKVRDAAQAELVGMGPGVAPAIEELAANADNPEVQQRARVILKQLALDDIERPTRVTLRFKQAPVEDVYRELFKQAGGELGDAGRDLFARPRPGEALAPVTVDLKNVTFWEAVLALEAETGVRVDEFGGRLRLTGPDQVPDVWRAVSLHGPYMIVADTGFMHRLTVFVEPRVRVIAHAARTTLEPAGDAGNDGRPAELRRPQAVNAARRAAERGRHFMSVRQDQHAFDVHVLNAPVLEGDGPVKGSVRLRVATAEQAIEFDGVAEARNAEKLGADGWRMTLNTMNPEPGKWFLMAVLSNPQRPDDAAAFDSAQPVVLDARGNVLTGTDLSTTATPRWTAYTLVFQQPANAGPPAKLRLTMPSATKEIEVPFEFKR